MWPTPAPDPSHSLRERLSVALILVALALVVSISGWLAPIDRYLFDLAQRLSPLSGTQGVVVVGIDQASLQSRGRWPWPRLVQAQLIERICSARPRVLAIDIAYSELGNDQAGNEALTQAMRSCSRVVLPVVLESTRVGGQSIETLPIQPLAQVAAAMGRVSVHLDSDGVARSVHLWEGVGSAAWPLLAQVALDQSGWPTHQASSSSPTPVDEPTTASPYGVVQREQRLLHFAGPPGTFPSISADTVLAPDTSLTSLRDQIVLVGATAVGLGDLLPTSATSQAAPMPGVEVLANVLVNLRDDGFITPVAPWWNWVVTALLAAIPLLWATRLMPLPGLMASIVWFGLLIGASLVLPTVLHVWLAPSGALAAAISVYPLWSWRRLEITRRHLDWELQQLAGTTSINPLRRLGFEQRIAYVQQAQGRFRELQMQRDETLAFFSHDIRAPLAAAAQQLAAGALDQASQQRLVLQLRRAHDLAQGFLSLIRAKNLESTTLREIELSFVVQQAADAVFEDARQRQLHVVMDLPDDPVWVKADFALLERAVSNLLHNALRHAPAHSIVTLGLHLVADRVRISVCDNGPGVPLELRTRLFQRFGTHESSGQHHPGSTGLGLYFVHTVAIRLGGSVGYEAVDPHGARFWVELPTLT